MTRRGFRLAMWLVAAVVLGAIGVGTLAPPAAQTQTPSDREVGRRADAKPPGRRESEMANWWKGNLHTHSLWSDGDDWPEMIVEWYKQHGYQFLALSDHNVLSEGERWVDAVKNKGKQPALDKYRARFGSAWVEERMEADRLMVRLKPLGEFRHLFEEAEKFLMIQGEEITDLFKDTAGTLYPVHLNATNLRTLIPPQGGSSVYEMMQKNVDAVAKQRQETRERMIVHLNHPNFYYAIVAEDMLRVEGLRFFEVYNGHQQCYNHGDADHPDTDRMWDVMLATRLAGTGEVMYGVAVDDAHDYHPTSGPVSNPGRGWIVVRAKHLTPEGLLGGMERGDFYATTGVKLRDVQFDGKKLTIEIDPDPGVRYRTQFIGTRRGYDTKSEPVVDKEGKERSITRTYSGQVGAVLAETESLQPMYTLKGDELYVRAKIVSSKSKENPAAKGDMETAWVQPAVGK